MASQNPIHTFSTPSPVAAPRAKPLATKARSAGYGKSSGLSDHSGRQGRIINITPSVAHKNTNSSTPMRRSHSPATERVLAGEASGDVDGAGETATGPGPLAGAELSPWGLNFPTPVESLAKGNLGSEIIARVVCL